MTDGARLTGSTCGEGDIVGGVGGKGPIGGGKGLIVLEGGTDDPGINSSFVELECPFVL